MATAADVDLPAPTRSRAPRFRRGSYLLLTYLAVLLLCAAVMLPLGWMITVALKPDGSPVFTVPPEWIPTEHWRWDNFWRALTLPTRPFARYTLNTLIIVAGNIVGTLFSCSLVAYAFAKLRFRGRDFLFNVLIITMLIPWQVLMIPQFLMFFKMGWYGTYLPLIVPSFFGNAFYIFLIRQYMRTLPASSSKMPRAWTAATTSRSSGTSCFRSASPCSPSASCSSSSASGATCSGP